jgi:hypothetical protein
MQVDRGKAPPTRTSFPGGWAEVQAGHALRACRAVRSRGLGGA